MSCNRPLAGNHTTTRRSPRIVKEPRTRGYARLPALTCRMPSEAASVSKIRNYEPDMLTASEKHDGDDKEIPAG